MSLVIADRVKETTATTGTGPLALAGAIAAFRAFSDVCSVADTCYYAAQGVDANGTPTGEWEVGLGTYSGVATLTRTTVLASSNGGAAVNFSAGTKQVWIDIAASQVSGFATLASPTFTGTPTAPTAAPGTNTTQIATTAYADAIAALKANLASPTFTGTVTGPTITATTKFLAPDGTAAAPGYGFGSAGGIGMSRTAGGYLGFSISNSYDAMLQASNGWVIRSDAGYSWSSSTDPTTGPEVGMWRDAANTVAQRNGVNAQAFRLYNTYTDASNYERIEIGSPAASPTNFGLLLTRAGTGLARTLFIGAESASPTQFRNNGINNWSILSAGHLVATDNTFDIGASGATRPRSVFVGTSVTSPTYLTGAPVTNASATYAVTATDTYIIANNAGAMTVTLPAAASFAGRRLVIKTITANTVVSNASNVVPQAGGAAGTAILAATAGKYAELISDGTNWVIFSAN